MSKFLLSFSFILVVFASFAQQHVYVNAYSRSDGTVVPSHYKTSPDHTVNNNFTTLGNTNPYTGKVGTLPRDSGYSIQAPQSSVNIPLVQSTLVAKQRRYETTITIPLDGGYIVPKIVEQVLQNGIWKTIKEESYNGWLFFDKDLVYFKRGQSQWLGRHQVFVKYNSEKQIYIYNSEFGASALDEYFRFIMFYDANNTNKRYLYVIGNSAPSITVE